MQYRYHSTRCRHGFDRSVVPCPGCGDKCPLDKVEARRYERAALGKRQRERHAAPRSAAGYAESETRGRGNRNAARGG